MVDYAVQYLKPENSITGQHGANSFILPGLKNGTTFY